MRGVRSTGLLLPTILLAISGCGMPIITADDVVMAPGQSARFVMSIDRRFGKTGVAGADVEFIVNGKRIGVAKTDADGMASIRGEVPEPASSYVVRATIGQENLRAQGRIFQWDPSRTAVAIDVDETISATDYGSLFLTDLDYESPHIEYSPTAVQAMAAHYGIVYLSARPRWLHEKTRVWLEVHGLPPGPILHASRFEACWKQEEYKRAMLADFKREFPNLLVGVGDKDVDERAYGDNHMLTVILQQGPATTYREHCVVLPGWRKIESFFTANRESLADANRLRAIIHANNMDLRTFFNGHELQDTDPATLVAADSAAVASPPAKTDQAAPSRPEPRRPPRGGWTNYGYQ